MRIKARCGVAAAAGLTLLSVALPSRSNAYTIDIVESKVDVTVSSRAGSNQKGPDTNTTKQVTNNSSQSTFTGSSLSAEISSSFALGLGYAIPFPRTLRTAVVLDSRTVSTGSLTGEAHVNVAGVITFELSKSGKNEGMDAGLLLESEFRTESGSSGYFVVQDLTSGRTLFDSAANGYPDSRTLIGHVGDTLQVRFGGTGEAFSLAGSSGGSTLRQRASLSFTATVPEPGTGLLASFGLAALGRFGRRRVQDA
jgi:hypothetical protein